MNLKKKKKNRKKKSVGCINEIIETNVMCIQFQPFQKKIRFPSDIRIGSLAIHVLNFSNANFGRRKTPGGRPSVADIGDVEAVKIKKKRKRNKTKLCDAASASNPDAPVAHLPHPPLEDIFTI